MFDFDIEFIDDISFKFIDNSDYTGLTVTSTELRSYESPITLASYKVINLFDDPVTVLGEDYTVNLLVDLDDYFTLYDNIYRFDYVVTSDENGVEITTKYFAKIIDLLKCRRKLVRGVVNSTEKCLACEAAFFDSVLKSIEIETEKGSYKEAELLIENLKNTCEICDCG